MQTIKFVIKPKDSGYYVYILHDAKTHKTLYVGYDEFTGLFSLRKIYRMLENIEYILEFTGPYKNQSEAAKIANEYVRKGLPKFNQLLMSSIGQKIICNETLVVYENAADCARKLDIGQANLSRHLRNYTGHKTVDGLTFSYLSHERDKK